MSNKKFKKAQMGETITWIVATIIIFVIFFFFIFGSSILAKTKNILSFKQDVFSKPDTNSYDLFLTKSLFTYIKVEGSLKGKDFYKILEKYETEGIFSESLEERHTTLKKILNS